MKKRLFLLSLLSLMLAGCNDVRKSVKVEETVVSAEIEGEEETLDTSTIPAEFDYLSYLTRCPFEWEDYTIENGYTTQSINMLERFTYLLSLHSNNGKLDSEEQFDELYETLMVWSEEALKASHYDCIALDIQPGKAAITVSLRFVNDRSMSFEIPATFVSAEEVENLGPTRIGSIDKSWFTDGVITSIESIPIPESFDWIAYCNEASIDVSFSNKLSKESANFFRRFVYLYGVYLDGLNVLELETFQNFNTSFQNWSGETAQFATYDINGFVEKLTADTDSKKYTWECEMKVNGEMITIRVKNNGLKFSIVI